MKKLFGLLRPEEARGRHAPAQNITSCNRSADSGTKKYVIFKIANAQYISYTLNTRVAI
jgi:hypothetical protein